MLKEFFEREGIFCYGEIRKEALRVINERKMLRVEEKLGGVESAILFLMPYYSGQKTTNLSIYAQPRDYHLFANSLSQRLLEYWKKKGLEGSFFLTADTSPVDERNAALKAGLGVLGKHGLLIHPRYGSFVFIGIVFLSKAICPQKEKEIAFCPRCGACVSACPTRFLEDGGACLSELTQKKLLTEEELVLVKKADCKWGCDLCQNACPLNQGVEKTPIPFFREDLLEELTEKTLSFSDEDLASRAFFWRGRAVLRRNLDR